MIVFQPSVAEREERGPGVSVNQEVEEGDGGQEAGEGAEQGAGDQVQSSLVIMFCGSLMINH